MFKTSCRILVVGLVVGGCSGRQETQTNTAERGGGTPLPSVQSRQAHVEHRPAGPDLCQKLFDKKMACMKRVDCDSVSVAKRTECRQSKLLFADTTFTETFIETCRRLDREGTRLPDCDLDADTCNCPGAIPKELTR